jgi:hypothetical protein
MSRNIRLTLHFTKQFFDQKDMDALFKYDNTNQKYTKKEVTEIASSMHGWIQNQFKKTTDHLLSGWKLDYFTPLIHYLSILAMISSKSLFKPTYAIAVIPTAVLHQ